MPTIDIRRVFSKKLRQTRQQAGYSVLQLARRSGVSRQHIRDLELAEKSVTLRTLCKLSNALGVPMWKLLQFGNGKCQWN